MRSEKLNTTFLVCKAVENDKYSIQSVQRRRGFGATFFVFFFRFVIAIFDLVDDVEAIFYIP